MQPFSALVLGTLVVLLAVRPAAAQGVTPGKTWERRTPAQVGMDAAKLDAFAKYVGGRGCVTRHVTYDTVDREVLRPMLTDLIASEDNPTMLAFGKRDRAGRVGVSPQDFCRFGLLYLRGGKWRDRQLISVAHAKLAVTSPLPGKFPRAGKKPAEMIGDQRSVGSHSKPDNQCDHLGSTSFLWWTNGVDRAGKRHWQDAPVDTYGAFGHGGIRAMIVIPSLDVVLSWNDTKIRGRKMQNRALALLVAAVTPRDARVNP